MSIKSCAPKWNNTSSTASTTSTAATDSSTAYTSATTQRVSRIARIDELPDECASPTTSFFFDLSNDDFESSFHVRAVCQDDVHEVECYTQQVPNTAAVDTAKKTWRGAPFVRLSQVVLTMDIA